MRAVSTVASGLRHSAVAVAEALLVAAIVAALLLALSPVYQPADYLAGTESAQAGRNQAWLSLSDDARIAAVSTGSQYTVVGGGFDPTTAVSINLGEPGCCRFFNVYPTTDGNIGFTGTAAGPGTYEVRAYQQLRGRKPTLMATLTFEVGG